MPADIFGEDYVFMREEELLSFDEIERLVTQFTSLGVKKIRINGWGTIFERMSLF